MKIEAYKCELCSFLTIHYNSYASHYKKCKQEKRAAEKERERLLKADELANSIRLELENIHDLSEKINKFFIEHYSKDPKLSITDLRFEEEYRSNWEHPINYKDTKKEHPAWTGHISYTDLNLKDKSGWSQDIIGTRGIIKGIHTGSGGGGGDRVSYSCFMFVEDFPKIYEKYKKYIPIKEKIRTKKQESNRLVIATNKELIEENEKIIMVGKYQTILNEMLKKSSAQKTTIAQEIKNSDVYKKAIIPDSKFNLTEEQEELFNEVAFQFS